MNIRLRSKIRRMLKELSVKEPERVISYLLRCTQDMPRAAFRYALEKLDREKRSLLMEKSQHKGECK